MFKNKHIFIYFLFAIISVLYLSYNLRYAIVMNDDIDDFFPYNWDFFHGRIFTELLSFLFIEVIPDLFNIPIQNFAFISEGFLKAFLFVFLIYISVFYNFGCGSNDKKSIITSVIIYILSIFTVLAIIFKNGFMFTFNINEYFQGYISAIIIFMFLWYILKNFYINDFNKINKKDYIILLVLTLLNSTSNEELTATGGFILFAIFIEYIFKYLKLKETTRIKKKYILASLLTFMVIILSSINLKDTTIKGLWSTFDLSFNLILSLKTISEFIFIYAKRILINNIFFIICLLTNIIILYRAGERSQVKYVLYTLAGLTIFQFGSILLPETAYCTYEKHHFWFLYCGLLSSFNICIYILGIYTTTYIYNMFNNKAKIITLALFVFCSCTYILNSGLKIFDLKIYTKETRTKMYICDKLSIFYLSRNKTAVLPNNLPFEIVQGIDPYDLKTNPQIYTKTYKNISYLRYIRHCYKVDTKEGITFLPYNEAMEEYRKNNGELTDEELKRLDFSVIKKQIE